MKLFHIFFTFWIIAGLLFSNFKPVAATNGNGDSSAFIKKPVATKVASPAAFIRVISNVFSSARVAPPLPQALLSDCKTPGALSSQLQGGSPVNLNQPAVCFGLSKGPAVSLLFNSFALTVKPLVSPAVNIVVRPQAVYNNRLSQAPVENNYPATVVVYFFTLSLFGLLSAARNKQRAQKTTRPAIAFFGLHQLCMMRC